MYRPQAPLKGSAQTYQKLPEKRQSAAFLISVSASSMTTARLVFLPEIFLVSIVPQDPPLIGVAANTAVSAAHSGRQAEGLRMNHPSKLGMPRLRVFAAMAGLVAFALMAGFSSRVSATSVSGPISLSGVHWIFYKEDFNHL